MLGASSSIMMDVYTKQIRCLLEYASPAWSSSICKKEIQDIERVQKVALTIIFGPQSYVTLLRILGQSSLCERCATLLENFTKR